MAAYEVVMRYQDREEVRLTDEPLVVGSNVRMAGSDWLVERLEAEKNLSTMARYICVELRGQSEEMRAQSARLLERSRKLRQRWNRDEQ